MVYTLSINVAAAPRTRRKERFCFWDNSFLFNISRSDVLPLTLRRGLAFPSSRSLTARELTPRLMLSHSLSNPLSNSLVQLLSTVSILVVWDFSYISNPNAPAKIVVRNIGFLLMRVLYRVVNVAHSRKVEDNVLIDSAERLFSVSTSSAYVLLQTRTYTCHCVA